MKKKVKTHFTLKMGARFSVKSMEPLKVKEHPEFGFYAQGIKSKKYARRNSKGETYLSKDLAPEYFNTIQELMVAFKERMVFQ